MTPDKTPANHNLGHSDSEKDNAADKGNNIVAGVDPTTQVCICVGKRAKPKGQVRCL
jgi:hypothetical protein